MDAEEILQKVCRSIDVLIEAGEKYDGLFPSLLDLKTHEMLEELPPSIEGQRQGDRAHLGSNLIHDQTVLKAMYGLSRALNRPVYADAADRYLRRFATHCTETVTGLFPWGEHAYWHLEEDRIGDCHELVNPDRAAGTTLHDHLRQAPVWMWEKIYEFNPECVGRFAKGLELHFREGELREYNRHAMIERWEHQKWAPKPSDAPRHGGFYILDWSFAYSKTARADILRLLDEMVDYHWPHRDEVGLLKLHTRGPEDEPRCQDVNIASQTLSLASSLLEAASVLGGREPDLEDRMRQRAHTYTDGFFSAPHDLDNGVFVYECKQKTGDIVSTMSIWGSIYGHWPAAYQALICLCIYRITGDERALSWAEAAGRCYSEKPFPEKASVPIMDPGMAIELLVDLYDLTGEGEWLDRARTLAAKVMSIYMDRDLPRGAPGIDWYESQMCPGDLIHGLARLALLEADRERCPLEPNYSGR